MKKKGFRIVSILVVFSLAALIAVQALSIASSYRSMNAQFAQKIKGAMERAAYDELVTRSRKPTIVGTAVTAIAPDSVDINLNDIPVSSITAISIDKSSKAPEIKVTTNGKDSLWVNNIPDIKNLSDVAAATYIFRMNFDNNRNNFKLESYDTLLVKNLAEAGIVSQYRLSLIDNSSGSVYTESIHDAVADPFAVSIPLDTKSEVICTVEIENPGRQFLFDMKWIIISSLLILILLCFTFWYLLNTLFRQKTLDEMRSDFTHNITHELKTPIAVAYAANDAMLNFDADKDPEKRLKYLNVVHDQLDTLSGMVQRILSITTLEKKDYSLTITGFPLETMLSDVISDLKMKYPGDMDIITAITPEDIMVNADEFHFKSVLANILDNAVKYSGEKVSIYISAYIEGNLKICIADKGIGISPADCRRIFDKFYRVHTGNLHDVKGSGLGLYYSRLIVEKHGGSIDVNSTPGKGTEFIINMPC